MPITLWIGDILLSGSLIYFLTYWNVELRFYSRHDWNFSFENPNNKYLPKFVLGLFYRDRMTNRNRLLYGYPCQITLFTFILLIFSFNTYRVLTCPFDDLEKCGIKVSWGSVSVKWLH